MSSSLSTLQKSLSVCIFFVLFIAVILGMGPNLSSRLVGLGEGIWSGYAQDLRTDPASPDCDLQELEERQNICIDAPKKNNTTRDPFADPKPQKDPFADEDPFADPGDKPVVKPQKDPFADEDPFVDPVRKPDLDPFAEEEKDPFADEPTVSSINCKALKALTERCAISQTQFEKINDRITTSVRVFRGVEGSLGNLAKFPYWKHLLVLLTLLGGISVTWIREHISLRNPESKVEHQISQGLQFVVHALWAYSSWADYQVQSASSAISDNIGIPVLWCIGFIVLCAVNVKHLIQVPSLPKEGTYLSRILMTIPLYVYMGLIAGAWFLIGEGHPSGQAIYLHKFIQHPTIYIGIGLYIWAGMLFATTRIARLSFGILQPWGLPIGILAWLTVVLAAFPTAYSGASGIFVIAAGAVIFEQLRLSGSTKRMALSATAMSGSLGVVLAPCLVVVLVAVLNKQVTTAELFSKGLWVFALTAILLLAAFLWRNKEPLTMNPAEDAWEQSKASLSKLRPYIILVIAILLGYGFILNTWVNEQTAALILPVIFLVLVVIERWKIRLQFPEEADQRKLVPVLMEATRESSTHIGALLSLMAASVALGGVVERAELMSYFPSDFGSPVVAMTALVFIMVLVGMTMDALGAVVLVSVTLAKVAYDNGIDPVHFWMMVLVAFELGYLTPPVALNHLLAKQVIGAEANLDDDDVEGFWLRNEHLWLPMLVMGTALLIVAYLPFFWYT
jgi:TRAP-type C4-dicarboxylate transport system permease large subunit